MARIIVWAKPDNDHPDPVIDAQKFKRGMVVDVLEDGQEAGADVEKGAWWRIVEAPGSASDYANLLGMDPEFRDQRQFGKLNPFPRKRVNALDLDALEAAAGLSRGDRPAEKVATTKAAALAQVKARAPVDNPTVLGEAKLTPVIG